MKFNYYIIIIIFSAACNESGHNDKGGYQYQKPAVSDDSNFYYYPMRNLISKRDSVYATLESRCLNMFDEPNLSLTAGDKQTYRFTLEGFKQTPIVLSLTDGKIIVKIADSTEQNFLWDEDRLSEMERQHLRFLRRNFDSDTVNIGSARKHFIDSMITAFPKLKDSRYYVYLINKTAVSNPNFRYKINVVKLDREKYQELVSLIDSSGYWHSPYKINCKYDYTDGYGFSLEANTRTKYNLVHVQCCTDDTTKFTRACQKLVDYAQLHGNIKLTLF